MVEQGGFSTMRRATETPFEQGGFSTMRRATETPFNIILEARP
jgi:hypothetical protein